MRKNNKRKAERIDFSCEAKIRFLGQDKEINVIIKDISELGMRAIIGGRIISVNTPLAIKMDINKRHIECKGRVVSILALRPAVNNIHIFDLGIEFKGINSEDKVFLGALSENKFKI